MKVLAPSIHPSEPFLVEAGAHVVDCGLEAGVEDGVVEGVGRGGEQGAEQAKGVAHTHVAVRNCQISSTYRNILWYNPTPLSFFHRSLVIYKAGLKSGP